MDDAGEGGSQTLFSIVALPLYSNPLTAGCGQHQGEGTAPGELPHPRAEPRGTFKGPERPSSAISVAPSLCPVSLRLSGSSRPHRL